MSCVISPVPMIHHANMNATPTRGDTTVILHTNQGTTKWATPAALWTDKLKSHGQTLRETTQLRWEEIFWTDNKYFVEP